MTTMQVDSLLGMPTTDKDTEMLSDNGLLDDFDIEVDAPINAPVNANTTRMEDDFMEETFEDGDDAEMVEVFEKNQQSTETDMLDDTLEDGGEDEDMLNIDLTETYRNDTDEFMLGSENVAQFSENRTLDKELDNPLTEILFSELDNESNQVEKENTITNEASSQNRPTGLSSVPELPTEDHSKASRNSDNPENTEAQDISAAQPDSHQESLAAENNLVPTLEEKEEITYDDDEEEVEEQNTEETNIESNHVETTTETHITQPQEEETTAEIEGEVEVVAEENVSVPEVKVKAVENGEEEHAEWDESEHYNDYSYDVIVHYKGEELSLFPPARSELPETFLLEDHSLAEKGFNDFFTACRSVLGDSISDQEALELEIPILGLYIHEDSSECDQCTLYQVLDVYLRLHHNDEEETPVPFTLVLQTRLRFNSRLSSLLAAADASIGFSRIIGQKDKATLLNTENSVIEQEPSHEDEKDKVKDDSTVQPKDDDQETKDNSSKKDVESDSINITQPQVEEEIDEVATKKAENTQVLLETDTVDSVSHSVEEPAHKENNQVKPHDQNDHDNQQEQVEDGEEDLIDYSDDEDDQVQESNSSTATIQNDVPTQDPVKNYEQDENEQASEHIHNGEDAAIEENDEKGETGEDDADYDWFDEHEENKQQESTAATAEQEEEDEFELTFDDDEEETPTKPASPLGKRSFDEHAEGLDGLGEDPEAKRIKQVSTEVKTS